MSSREYRRIDSRDELDALPIESIIRDRDGLPLWKDDTKDDDNHPGPYWCYGDDAVSVELPALVLWEPRAEKGKGCGLNYNRVR